jgi:hypothetical protein
MTSRKGNIVIPVADSLTHSNLIGRGEGCDNKQPKYYQRKHGAAILLPEVDYASIEDIFAE